MKTNNLPMVSLEEKMARIENLNLEPIMVKLMDVNEGMGWSLEQALVAEVWYKRFLTLNLLYPNKTIVPNKQIDSFWHFHILDTMKYQEDCDLIFGFFLHHFPYLGLRGQEDAELLSSAFDETLLLFANHFGENLKTLSQVFSMVGTCHGSNCGNSNGKSGCSSGCQSTCHVSCYSSCHSTPVEKTMVNFTRPTLFSNFSKSNNLALN